MHYVALYARPEAIIVPPGGLQTQGACKYSSWLESQCPVRSAEGCRAVQGGAGQGVHMAKPRRNKAEGTHSGSSLGRYRGRSAGRSCGSASPQLKSGGGTPTFLTIWYDGSMSWSG